MQEVDFIFSIAVLIMSVVAHEVSHGFVANIMGDPTARLAGRLTLNPVKHLDPVGSFLVPLLTHLASAGGFLLGWAKPVPYNPYNLRDQRWGDAKVALAGPATNLGIALLFSLLIRFGAELGIAVAALPLLKLIVLLNIVLAIFNLMPIPPLDGSKVLFSILPYRFRGIQEVLENYWLIFIAIFILFLWDIISPLVFFLFRLMTGIPL